MPQKVDEKYLDALEKFDLTVMTYDERMELIRLARVGLKSERNLTKRAADGGYECQFCGSIDPNVHVQGGGIPRHR